MPKRKRGTGTARAGGKHFALGTGGGITATTTTQRKAKRAGKVTVPDPVAPTRKPRPKTPVGLVREAVRTVRRKLKARDKKK